MYTRSEPQGDELVPQEDVVGPPDIYDIDQSDDSEDLMREITSVTQSRGQTWAPVTVGMAHRLRFMVRPAARTILSPPTQLRSTVSFQFFRLLVVGASSRLLAFAHLNAIIGLNMRPQFHRAVKKVAHPERYKSKQQVKKERRERKWEATRRAFAFAIS